MKKSDEWAMMSVVSATLGIICLYFWNLFKGLESEGISRSLTPVMLYFGIFLFITAIISGAFSLHLRRRGPTKRRKRKKRGKLLESKKFILALLGLLIVVVVIVIFLAIDWDRDGLTTITEVRLGTNPFNSDTDGDGLKDDLEINTYMTNPSVADTDNDGLNDYQELNVYRTDPLAADTDRDVLKDGLEVNTYMTNPLVSDTDGDGLSDGLEISLQSFGADPRHRDIFVEIDLMAGARSLTANEQNMLISTFRNAPIINPDGSWGVELHLYFDDVDLPYVADSAGKFYEYRNMYKNLGRGFYYALLTSSENYYGAGSSHEFGFDVVARSSTAEDRAGSVFMHELGHAIGLMPSVFDGIDSRKYSFSEYGSVMNYNASWIYYGYSSGGIFYDWGYLGSGGFKRWV